MIIRKILDIGSAIAGLGGSTLLSKFNKHGFILYMICSICTAGIAWYAQSWGLFLTSIIFIVLDYHCFIQWKHHRKCKCHD